MPRMTDVADMVRVSGRRIRRLGIITFEIDTTQTAGVHGSKFDLDKILEEMVKSAQGILK